jgi:iron complex transport system substrate-binding protein
MTAHMLCLSTFFQRTLMAAVGAAVLAAPPSVLAEGITVRDAAARDVTINDASRIVSIGGAVTEILYALKLEQRIAAVDSTSLFPPQAFKTKANVGYLRQLSPEGVLGLNPTLVLAADGAGPKEAVAVLETAAVPYVRVPDHFTGEGILEKIRLISAATGETKRGDCLAASVRADLDALAKLRASIKEPVRVIFILSLANGRAMVAGRGTAADGIIRLAGAQNAITQFEGYKPINEEAIVAAKPQAVLAMEREGYKLNADEVLSGAGFNLTPAAASKLFVSMEGQYLLGFGPRTARAARDLAHALDPRTDAQLPSDTSGAASPCAE